MCWVMVIAFSVPCHINFLMMRKAIRLYARLQQIKLYETLINNDIQPFGLLLLKDREWADNHVTQANADAFGVYIEIINFN